MSNSTKQYLGDGVYAQQSPADPTSMMLTVEAGVGTVCQVIVIDQETWSSLLLWRRHVMGSRPSAGYDLSAVREKIVVDIDATPHSSTQPPRKIDNE